MESAKNSRGTSQIFVIIKSIIEPKELVHKTINGEKIITILGHIWTVW